MQQNLKTKNVYNVQDFGDSGISPRLTFIPVEEISRAVICPLPVGHFEGSLQSNIVLFVRNKQSCKVITLFKQEYTHCQVYA